MRRAIAAGAVLLVLLAAVVALRSGLPWETGQPGAGASAAPVTPPATLLAPPATPVEPPVTPVHAWGPLAVIPPQGGADTGRAEGTLRITGTCVLLESGGTILLLIWPADRTMWDAELRAITFMNYDGAIVTVSDGDHVVLGGGGDSAAESGVTGEEWVRRMTWVVPPASSCPLDERWGVGAVGR